MKESAMNMKLEDYIWLIKVKYKETLNKPRPSLHVLNLCFNNSLC
jgi:hypothetical protein